MKRLRRLVRRPFKGSSYYEWQVGALVMQIAHVPNWREIGPGKRVHLWCDRYWA